MSGASPSSPWQVFRPILAGATLQDRAFASFGAVIGIAMTALICGLTLGQGPHLILLVPPMGASAVLVFAVPASPLAQPWPTIGGNVVSAFVGITVAHFIHEPALAAGVAVGLAIAAMSLLRCIHPPGGAAALVAVFGGPAVAQAGFLFPIVPVGLNAVLLVGFAWLFHRFSRHSFPHVPAKPAPAARVTTDPPPSERVGFTEADIDVTLRDLGETFDISTADLRRLLREVETRALARTYGSLSCGDVMSRDVVAAGADDTADAARALLLKHDLRMLPVIDAGRRVLGMVGFREIATAADGVRIRDVMAEAVTAPPERPAVELAGVLKNGQVHAVVIADQTGLLLGVVTQTDLLAVLSDGLTRTPALRQD